MKWSEKKESCATYTSLPFQFIILRSKRKKKKSIRHKGKFVMVRSLFCTAQRNSTGAILCTFEHRSDNVVEQIAIVFEKRTSQDRQIKIEVLKGIRSPGLSLVKF